MRPQVTSNKTENAAGFELSCVPVCHNQKSFHSGVVECRAEIHILVKIEQTLFDLLSFGLIDPNPNILALQCKVIKKSSLFFLAPIY